MVKILTESHMQQCPVWKWDDSMEWRIPVEDFDPLPDEATLFISARFETADGHRFNGYLTGSDAFFAFGFFVDGRTFVMNLNLPDMIGETVAEISKILGGRPIALFPLRYETDVHFANQQNLSGTLTLE